MKFADLERTLKSVLDTGRLGTPVALRIYAMLPEEGTDLPDAIGMFAPLVRLVADESSGTLLARRHPNGNQGSVLWMDAKGRTVFLSVVSVPLSSPGLHVLLIGNHGITRLSGGEFWKETGSSAERLWREEIRESLQRGTSIRVGTS